MTKQEQQVPPSDTDANKSKNKQRRHAFWQWLRRDIFFYGLVFVLAVLALLLVWPYLSSILLALAAVVISKPIYDWFLKRRWLHGKTKWATLLTILTDILLIAVPMILFFSAAFSQAQDLISQMLGVQGGNSIQELLGSIESGLQRLPGGSNLQVDENQTTGALQNALTTIGNWLGSAAVSLGAALPSMFMGAIIAIAVIMALLPHYDHVSKSTLEELIPFPEQITKLYINKTKMMINAMFRGTFVIAFAQGAAMGLVLWIAGVPSVLFFTLLSMVSALLPVVGLSIVAVPIGVILLLDGQTWQGLWVLGAYLLVVQNIDVVLRPRLVPEGAYLNPALLLLGVFGGINLLGPIGALYGPVVMVLLVTSVSVYSKYMLQTDLQPFLDANGNLDLQKLGLEPDDDDSPNAAKEHGKVEQAANHLINRLLNHSETPPQENGDRTKANGDDTDSTAAATDHDAA